MLKNKKMLLVGIIAVVVIVAIVLVVSILNNGTKEMKNDTENVDIYETEEIVNNEEDEVLDKIVDVVDVNSNSRPYAVVINNTDVAVKVQEGLNDAYIVYEIPTEGNTSRLLALYKDVNKNLVMGTIRSARHNFIDFALESDAIFCCFGWSHYAEDDLRKGCIDYIQGLFGDPYYRKNPEGLASEHTAYVNMDDLKSTVQKNNIRSTSTASTLLNYNTVDEDLTKANNSQVANNVVIPYGAAPQIASFKYNADTKMYTRYENNIVCLDHNTKEEVTTKNIIVQKVDYLMCNDGYYWDLKTIGSGEGYYITNGYAIKINWNKDSRNTKTKYTYAEGTTIDGVDMSGKEISVSDGRTWIEVQTLTKNVTIN